MPADYYQLTRASITADYITGRRARELYAEAQSEPQAELHGDLETGFYFWTVHTDSNLKLVHFRVTPVHANEVPEDVRERLDASLNIPDAPPPTSTT